MRRKAFILLSALALATGETIKNPNKNNCPADINEEALYPHNNCLQFYQCVKGEPIIHDCPQNLLFNDETQKCDWSENVNCQVNEIPDPGGDSNSGGNDDPSQAPAICAAEGSNDVLVAHENCNQFYICDNGKPTTMSCSKNLLYNPVNEICDWPEEVRCGDRVIPDGEDRGDGEGNGNGCGVGNCNPSEAPSICAAEGSDGILVAHEKCNKYYICSFGKPLAVACGTNLLFNPAKDQCDWPDNVNCGDRVIPDTDEEDSNHSEDTDENDSNGDSESNESGDDDNSKEDGDNDNEVTAICAADDSNNVLVAHEICSKFYICLGGTPFVLNCPLTLLYNPNTGKCDWAENVKCGDRIVSGEDNEDGGDCDGNSGDDDNSNNDHDHEAVAIAVCAGEGTDGTLLAHDNCKQFYICHNHEATVHTCPAKLLFDTDNKRCDWSKKVTCDKRVMT